MNTMDISTHTSPEKEQEVPMVGIASALALAVAGSLLGYSLLSKKRRLPISGQIFLGVLAGCAGAVTWMKRQEELEAAHQFAHHVHVVRDARWIKKNPVAYG